MRNIKNNLTGNKKSVKRIYDDAKQVCNSFSRISEKKLREIVRYFSMDLEATKISKLTCLSRQTINKYLKVIRERIGEYCKSESPFNEEIELDESYFERKRVKGKGER